MKYVQFFFYNNLLDIHLLNEISENIKIIPSYILVDQYNEEKNEITISNKESINKKILKGILVKFDIFLGEILEKLNNIDELKNKNKSMYKMDIVDVNIYKDETTTAYIVY
jgi:hypothetical protein